MSRHWKEWETSLADIHRKSVDRTRQEKEAGGDPEVTMCFADSMAQEEGRWHVLEGK